MNLVCVGINHRTAPVEVRERYAVAPARWVALNEKLVAGRRLHEAAVISTCNRTEILATVPNVDAGMEFLDEFFALEIGDATALPEHFERWRGREALNHLFRVAASLDSMVLGEAQILGQIKDAYAAAAAAGSCGPLLNRLFHRAFRAAKRVRSETGLGSTPISIARVGVQLAREVFESFDGKRVLLIGAGEMAESALWGFRDAGVSSLVIINRTLATAESLASRCGGRAALLSALDEELRAADVALTSVAVEEPLFGAEQVARCMERRQGRPLLMIDLGMPRNIDPAANDVDNAVLYDLDDLDEVAERGRERRRESLGPAEAILAEEIERFERWQAALQAAPVIRELLAQSHAMARDEARRAASRLAGAHPEAREVVERMAEAIVAKLLHRPVEALRAEAAEGRPPYYADVIRAIFGVAEDDG